MKKYIFIFFIILLFFKLLKLNNIENYNQNKKTILVTGSSNGIGEMIVNNLDKNLYQIIITGRDSNKIKNIKNELLKKGIDCIGIKADFKKLTDIKKLYNKSIKKYGKIDILINNMYNISSYSNINSMNDISIYNDINSNLTNVIIFTKMIINNMIGRNNGKIINISSGISDLDGYSDNLIYPELYILIKNSIEKLTKLLSKYYYKNNICVTCFKIDDSYNTKIHNHNFNINLKNSSELFIPIKYLLDVDNKKITGRIIYSNELINNKFYSLFDSNYKLIANKLWNEKDKKVYGNNYFKMSNKINEYLQNTKILDFKNYPDKNDKLIKLLENKYSIKDDNILLSNGITYTLRNIIKKFCKNYHELITFKPGWYELYNIMNDLNIIIKKINVNILHNELKFNFNDFKGEISSLTRIIYLIAPIKKGILNKILDLIPDNILILIDFCYDEFCNSYDNVEIKDYIKYNNIIGLYSMSKFYCLADLNIGYIITNSKLIDILKKDVIYKISNFKTEICCIALEDINHNNNIKNYYINEKKKIINKLLNNNINYIDIGQTNILIKIININFDILIKNNIIFSYSDIDDYYYFLIYSPDYNLKFINLIINKYIF